MGLGYFLWNIGVIISLFFFFLWKKKLYWSILEQNWKVTCWDSSEIWSNYMCRVKLNELKFVKLLWYLTKISCIDHDSPIEIMKSHSCILAWDVNKKNMKTNHPNKWTSNWWINWVKIATPTRNATPHYHDHLESESTSSAKLKINYR